MPTPRASHPRPLVKGCIVRSRCDHIRQPLDNRKLLITIECAGIRENLDPNVTAVPINVGDGLRGISWTNAPTFCRNIGMSGACGIAMTAAAASEASR
jgi:hypothetical protein